MGKHAANIIGAAVSIVAACVLMAWVFRIDPVITIRPNWSPMQFNTALCFLLLGLRSIYRGRLCWALPAAALTLAAVTVMQDMTGLTFGVDELFLKSHIFTQNPSPGRMAPSTAFGFIALSLASLMFFKHRVLSETLATVTAGVAAVSLAGYIPGFLNYYSWGDNLTSMAAHTAILQLTLALMFLFVGAAYDAQSRKPDARADAARRFESNVNRIKAKFEAGEQLTDQERFFLNGPRG